WLREHTRYLQRATEWDRGGRPANRLLSGDDIAEAKAWAARRPKNAPEPTALHLDFIRASEEEAEARSSAQRKQLEERETAVRKREEAQRKRATMARVRNIALVAVSIFAVLAVFNGWHVVRQAEQAEDILANATHIIVTLQPHMDIDTEKHAFAVFQRGADRGYATSMGNLGWLYSIGHGVAQDYAKAREWFEKAADDGDPYSMHNLGLLYAKGFGVAQDYAKAREWFEKAADKDRADAMHDLGWLYQHGHGMAQDYAKAREWFEKAADKGDAYGMHSL